MNKNLFIALVLNILVVNFVEAQDSLVLSSTGSPIAKVAEKVLKKAYQRIGIQIQIEIYPAARALKMSNNGEVNGEVNRIKGINKKFLCSLKRTGL